MSRTLLETSLVKDTSLAPIEVLGVDDANANTVATSTSSARVAFPVTSGLIEVTSDADIYIQIGGSSVDATTTSRFVKAGAYRYKILEGQTHVAGILSSGTGNLTVAELQ